jgi:hypothetical protein
LSAQNSQLGMSAQNWGDAGTEATAHRGEPIELLRAVEGRGHGCDVADQGVTDRAGTNERRSGVLGRKLNVGLEPGHQPVACHPIVAALKARLAEEATGIARRVDLLVVELGSDRADERAERRRHRHELDFAPGFLGVVVERRLNAVDAVVADAELVVVILDRAGPEADDVDRRALWPKLNLCWCI